MHQARRTHTAQTGAAKTQRQIDSRPRDVTDTVYRRHETVTVHQLHAACIKYELDDPRVLDHPLVVDAIKRLHTHGLRLRGAPTLADTERAQVDCA